MPTKTKTQPTTANDRTHEQPIVSELLPALISSGFEERAEGELFSFPASVSLTSDQQALLQLMADRDMLDPSVMKEDDPTVPFFFRALISNNRIDSYFTRMHESTLENFAQDAIAGVSLQNSHNTHVLGHGRSLTGEVSRTKNGIDKADGGGDLIEVASDFYIVPGLNLNGTANDQVISALRWGSIKDVSVGFYGGEYRCSICGRDMWWDWDCFHIPGVSYEQLDRDGNVSGDELAIAWIIGARLSEVSLVYDGATPGAAVVKARMEAERGRIPQHAIRMIEQRYRIHLPEAKLVVAKSDNKRAPAPELQVRVGAQAAKIDPATFHTITDSKIKNLRNRRETPAPIAVLENVREIVPPAGNDDEGDPAATAQEPETVENTEPNEANETSETTNGDMVNNEANTQEEGDRMPDIAKEGAPEQNGERMQATVQVDVTTLALPGDIRTMLEKHGLPTGDTVFDTFRLVTEEAIRLRPLADDGKKFREALVDEAIAEGKRAAGNDFPEEQYRANFATMPLDMITFNRDQFRTQAGKTFGPGRQSVDDAERDQATTRTTQRDVIPAHVYEG